MILEHYWQRKVVHQAVKISGVRALYLNNLLREMAGSMVAIFFPAYVFLWGFESGGLTLGFRVLILSLVIERGGVFLLAGPLGRLVNRIGFKMSILLSSLLLSVWFILPAIFDRSLVLIIALSVVAAILIPIYWLARLSILSLDGDKDRYGGEVSFLALLDQVSSILGPFVGGVLVATSGFGLLFAVATFICLLSAIPIFFVGDYQIKNGISLSRFEKWMENKKERHLHWSFIGQGLANMVDANFWPLYVYLIVGSFTVLGALTSITFALSAVAIYLAGRVFDKKRALGGTEDEKEYSLATIFLGLLTLLRPLIRGVLGLLSFDAVFRMSLPFWGVDYDAYLYSAGKRAKSVLEFFTYREVIYSLSRVVGPMFLLLFVGTNYFWWVVFGLGSVGTWLTLGMQKES
ncbi:MAG: MFS transporter [Patescibacteria group bacterium]